MNYLILYSLSKLKIIKTVMVNNIYFSISKGKSRRTGADLTYLLDFLI